MKLTDYIVIIAIAVATFLIIQSRDVTDLSQLEKENQLLHNKIDSVSLQIDSAFSKIKIINEQRTINRNYYITKENEIDTIQNIDSLRNFIRLQLDNLGSARISER